MKTLLDATQKKFLAAFQKSELAKYFYWTGGTLLAEEYLHHRFSEDLDFFSDRLFFDEYIAAQIAELRRKTGAKSVQEVKRLNRRQFVFEYGKRQLKVEFVYFPFPRFDKRQHSKCWKINIDSLRDIAANKTHAAFERNEPKDVFDFYWIIQRGRFSLLQCVKFVEKKLGVKIDPVTLIAKLIDALPSLQNLTPLITDKNLLQPEKMKKYFEKKALAYLKKEIR
ncbi:nucleotidyl transferase AbiEii/AbiGii toxin family protein [Candidatus Peregrinibacteria bacterium]|nr:nucleotidyl transferase AbiEii/AbiGii toxin family protein [Candidatus Peregrinibacteria bacterium]